MNAVEARFDIAKKTILISPQPAVIFNADFKVLFSNEAFQKSFPSTDDLLEMFRDTERESLQTNLEADREEAIELFLTIEQGQSPRHSKWRFQYIEEIDSHIGFGQVFEEEKASVTQVAEQLMESTDDITDFSRHLTSNIDKVQLITDHISDVVCLHHPDDARYLYVSPSVTSLVGYLPTELEGKTPYEFFHPDFLELLEKDHQRSAEGTVDGPPPVMDVLLLTKGGGKKWASVHSHPLFDEEGNVALIISSARDISDRKKYEEELIRKNRELNAFSYRISHDLRSPLTTIMALTNLIESEYDIEKVKEYSHLIMDRVNSMDRVIKSIMDYARNMNNKVIFEEVNLPEMVKELIAAYSYHAHFERLSIATSFEVSMVHQDRIRMKIILNCLLSNAYNFADKHKDNSTLDLHISLSDSILCIVFKDNGIGISDRDLDRIREMFYRGTSLSQGAGLGLYIVEETIKQLHGSLCISSEDGEGTIIRVGLPIGKLFKE
ncbi:ATP-binding protein [Reichenbachiella versicolor]|uniref:ATP-binding protein n=1 Tax=Reichenbachiella versicolor TaxID=1821036 RepID=UPI000D6E133B|nr:ATP-binding protein [Reichenbachiella versicolor]